MYIGFVAQLQFRCLLCPATSNRVIPESPGQSAGQDDGAKDGNWVGSILADGDSLCMFVGLKLGAELSMSVGLKLDTALGAKEGVELSTNEGLKLGSELAILEGDRDDMMLGISLGCELSNPLGLVVVRTGDEVSVGAGVGIVIELLNIDSESQELASKLCKLGHTSSKSLLSIPSHRAMAVKGNSQGVVGIKRPL